MIIDDLPHDATRRYIRSQPFDVALFNSRNAGLGRSLTRIYSVLETRRCFHCEDDWDFLRPFDVQKMQTLMKREADLGQLVLHREQPIGSIVERDGYGEFAPFFSLNPHLGRFETIIQGFPFERRSAEFRLTKRMRCRDIRAGIYGWGTSRSSPIPAMSGWASDIEAVNGSGAIGLCHALQNNSTSPNASAQFASGGKPSSFTARHVRMGPPPGNPT